MKKLSRILASVLAVSMLFGCGGQPSSSSQSSTGGEPAPKVVRIALGEEGHGFDPAVANDLSSNSILTHTSRGMFALNGNKLEKALCADYTVNEDATKYTFTIREDAKWSDGTPITAEDFLNGLKRVLMPEIQAEYANFVYDNIKGAKDVYEGKAAFETIGAKALDARTLELTLNNPCSYLPQMMVFSVFHPVSVNASTTADSKWAMDPATALSSGAFQLESYKTGDTVVLVKNPNFYEADKVKIERLEFKFMGDMQAQVAAFKTGEIDVATNVPTDIYAQYKDSPELCNVETIANYYVALRDGTDAVKDVRVRKALALAVNRQELCEILGGGEKPLFGLVPPGIQNSTTGKDFRAEGGDLFQEDLAEAKRLLAEAGYPDGAGFPELTYLYNSNQRHEDTAQAIQAMWKTNLGIDVKLQSAEMKVFFDERTAGNFQMCRHAMTTDYVDPSAFLGMYTSDSVQNESKFADPAYDALYQEANAQADPGKRMELLHQAEAILISENMRMIPLYTYGKPILVKENITGFAGESSGTVNFNFADMA